MTYCEQTDTDIYSLHLNTKQIRALQTKLNGTLVPELILLLENIRNNSRTIPKAGFERRRSIKICNKCSGSGKIEIGNLHGFGLDDCPVCQGEGHIAEITIVYFEQLTSALKTNLYDDKL